LRSTREAITDEETMIDLTQADAPFRGLILLVSIAI
jgi:hypothetical protein